MAAMVLAVSERDRKLEQDLATVAKGSDRGGERVAAGERMGVVEFDGDDGDDGRGGERRRAFSQSGHGGAARARMGAGKKAPVAAVEGAPVRHIPGKLANADILPGKDSAEVGAVWCCTIVRIKASNVAMCPPVFHLSLADISHLECTFAGFRH